MGLLNPAFRAAVEAIDLTRIGKKPVVEKAAKPEPDWQAIQAAYEGHGIMKFIAASFGISTVTIQRRARKMGWKRK